MRFGVVALLLLGGALCLALERSAGYPGGAFAWLVPFTWLGALVVLDVTHPRALRRADWLRSFGCLTVLVGVTLLFLLALLTAIALRYTRGQSRSWAAWIVGTLLVVALSALLGRARRASPAAPQSDQRARLQAAAELIEALADDAAQKPASGYVDLTGHEQPSKLLRSGTSPSGWKISLYRDEWLRLRLVLRDGNRLRVALVDRVKVRAGRFKRGRSGKSKWKSGRSDWLSTLELQLVVNPAVYALEADATTARPGVLTHAQPCAARAFDPTEALRAVAALYGRLERLPAGSRS